MFESAPHRSLDTKKPSENWNAVTTVVRKYGPRSKVTIKRRCRGHNAIFDFAGLSDARPDEDIEALHQAVGDAGENIR
jgi:hypothetical protein